MSQKIPIPMGAVGKVDTDTNDLRVEPGTARLLQNIGDLYNEGEISLQPGYKNLYSAPVMANCTVGTVAVSNGSATVTGSGTTWITHATHAERPNPGDIFRGPDGQYYTIKSIETDTSLTLESKYEGATDASSTVDPSGSWVSGGTTSAIIHKVWLLHQFYSEAGAAANLSGVNLSGGTHTNTEKIAAGIQLSPDTSQHVGGPSVYGAFVLQTTGSSDYAGWGQSFTLSANSDVEGVWLWMPDTSIGTNTTDSGDNVTVEIQTDNAGVPSGTKVTSADGTISGDATQGKEVYVDFSGTVSLTASTTYWITIERNATFEDGDRFFIGLAGSQDAGTIKYYFEGDSWTLPAEQNYDMWHCLLSYPTSGTNNWESGNIDIGYTPVEDGTVTITRTYTTNVTNTSEPHNSDDTSDTFTWDLEKSTTGLWAGEEASVTTGETGTTYTIGSSDYARYYRIILNMTSNDGSSSPLVTDIEVVFPELEETTGTSGDSGGRSFLVTGAGNSLFQDAKPNSSNTLLQPYTNSGKGEATAWQRKLFISTGNDNIKYWNGVDAIANVDDLTKNDGTAGDDPVDRAQRLVLHNDRMFYYKNVERDLVTGASTALAATRLTDTTADWTGYEDDELISFRVYPNTDGATGNPYPRKWYTITDNDKSSEYVDASGVDMTNYATAGDAFRVARNYDATTWYSGQDEPADNSSTDLLVFGEDDGDDFQAMISWKRRLYAVMEDSVWRVVGYGPSTPWEKAQVSKGIGTLSPYSVIVAGDVMFWWAPEGIVAYQGGYNQPEIISNTLKALVKDGINQDAIHHIEGIYHDGMCYWSYPASGSNINNRTLVYNPSTGRVVVRTFGMYSPMVYVDDKGNTALYFFEPTSGLIHQYDVGYTFDGAAQDVELKLSHIIGGSPHTDSNWQRLLAVIDSDSAASVSVSIAKDYSSSFSVEGTLEPWNADISSRSGVSSSDVAYMTEFRMNANSQILSPTAGLQLTATLSDRFVIKYLELICDPVDIKKYEEV